MSEIGKIPKLRFLEFDGQWKEKYLEKDFKLISGQHLNPDEYTTEVLNRGTPYFTGPSDFTNDIGHLKKWCLKEGKEAESGDILFTVKGSGVGTSMFLTLEKVAMGRQLMAIRSKKSSTDFLFQILDSFRNFYVALASGNMIPGLSRSDLLKTKIFFPQLEEQQKIATFLTAVDKKIALLQQKKSLLEQYKKGVMQQIFSQELRFKDDDGNAFADWEVKRLAEIGEFKNGINKDKKDFGFGFPFVNLMDVFGKPTVSNLNLDLINANDKELNLYELKKGDVLFIRSSVKKSGVGETSVVLNDIENTVYSGFLIRFRDTKISINIDYKRYCFWNKKFRNDLISLSTTSANTNINQESLNKLTLQIPSKKEQAKIANFLLAIDAKIALVNTQLENTKQFKKGLLQQMFV